MIQDGELLQILFVIKSAILLQRNFWTSNFKKISKKAK